MLERSREFLSASFAAIAARIAPLRYADVSRVPSSVRTIAGVPITPDTAVTVAAVWACLRYLSQTVAVLPWHVMLRGARGGEIAATHPIDWMLSHRPSTEWSSFQFRETLTHWALRWGNGYAEIEPDSLGRPFALWPLHPDRVTVCRATEAEVDTHGVEIALGDLYYEVSNSAGLKTVLSAARMFHIRGFGEGPVGVNVIAYAAQSIGWARAAQLFGAAFFGNGATPSTVVRNKKALTPAGLARQKAEFDQLYKGPTRQHKTAHLDNDAEVVKIGLNAAESQLIEVHQHLVEEICRWFGVPPHKVAHLLRSTFNNIEHQAIEVVVDSISPWVKRFEDEADYKLFGNQNRRGYYTKINMNALLRGDMKARMEFYKGMRDVGAFSPNRVLELEDEETIGPDGDIHVMQSQYTTLDRIGEEPAAAVVPATPESPDEEPPADPDDPETDQAQNVADIILSLLAKAPVHAG